jgi:hypothetical protein
MCAAACTANGNNCATNDDCCSGICSGEGICAAECTIGPELGGAYCNAQIPCCAGAGLCFFGACFDIPDLTCQPHTDGPCDDLTNPCCFDNSCDEVTQTCKYYP